MSIEYKDRGLLHKITNHTKFKPHKSKNALVRLTAKSALRMETARLFVTDVATNKLVGKEFHIKFDRQKNKKGKYHTHFKIVRADAPLYKERGALHRVFNLHRRFEGDVPTFLKNDIRLLKPVKQLSLGSETALIKLSGVGINKLKNKTRNELESSDSGKAVLTTISTAITLNNVRKKVINQRIKKNAYRVKKTSFKAQKSQLKKTKKDLKLNNPKKKLLLRSKKTKFNQAKRDYKANKDNAKKQQKYLTLKQEYKFLKKSKKFEKKNFKNQKKRFKNIKKQKKLYKPKPLVVQGVTSGLNKINSSVWQKMVATDPDNDFLTATSKVTNYLEKRSQKAKHYKAKRTHKVEKKETKLTQQQNKLKTKESKLKQSKKSSKSKKTTKKASNTTKKTVQKIEKVIFDFAKFAFKGLGTILAPMLVVILIFALLLMMFAGTSSNSTYLLGTYNCLDSEMGEAIDTYTKIAYDFNKKVIKCQNSSSWRSGLRDFGINTWDYTDTPTEFIFSRSREFDYDAIYDFDYDKLIAFMCAYTYPFSSDDTTVSDNDDIEKWTYRSSYDSVLEELFYAEYEFQHRYINTSHWISLSSYEIFPSNDSLYYVNGSGTTTISGITYGFLDFSSHGGVPSALQEFTSDGVIHFSLTTGEVKNRRKSYGKTGYFIQNLNYQYTDSSGGVLNSFYTWYSYASGSYFGFFADGMEQRKTQLYVNGMEFNYVVAKEDTRKFTGDYSENRQLMRFYKGEEYITECKLYTNVKQLRTFDEAIRYVLGNQEYSTSRLEFYNTLLNGELPTYGNHQTYQSPLPSSFSSVIEGNKIYNGYGYDMQAWNTTHCSLEKHHGLDIIAPTGTNVLAMISGKVDSIDTSKHTITLYSDNITYWYDKNKKRKTKINYVNINVSSSLNVGDTVNVGDVIGTVSNYKHCNGNFENSSATNNYLHISVQINYGNAISADWCDVDPRFLIYLS